MVTEPPEPARANPTLPPPRLLPVHSLAMSAPLLEAQVAHIHSGLISENLTLCI